MTREDLAKIPREQLETAILGVLNEKRTHYPRRNGFEHLNGYAMGYNLARNYLLLHLGFESQTLEEAFGPVYSGYTPERKPYTKKQKK